MALSRKKWNNIIIIASILMVSVLTVLNEHTGDVPVESQSLFDDSAMLSQLQLGELWLQKRRSGWQCDVRVLNCLGWANAWKEIQVSPLNGIPETVNSPIEVIIQIEGIAAPQLWVFFAEQGLLKSPAGNWYLVPPGLREALQPIINANPLAND